MKTQEQELQKDWKFVEEIKKPLHDKINFNRFTATNKEADLSSGITVETNVPDPDNVLDTAYADLNVFMSAASIQTGPYKIITEFAETECYEAYRIIVDKTECRVQAADTEGIRRALVCLEDEICRTNGPFLPLGTITRKPVIRTRISRCFFGPVKRPPMNRDELADQVDYYPDEYLNKLVHEGVNALWLTISFKDLCHSPFFPTYGADREKRLAKLRKTAQQCARFGIKIYIFCIEPWGFGENTGHLSPLSALEKHPELAGHKSDHATFFCTSSQKGQQYLEDCTTQIFTAVPELGGLIDINMGERSTHCYSATSNFINNNCPRCSKRTPGDVFADTTSALVRGMHKGNPDAEMVSWLYVPYMFDTDMPIEDTLDVIRGIAAKTPKNVTFQYNFESLGKATQLGKERYALDYWLSWPGPSDVYKDCVTNAIQNGARASAKIQVGCSHEVATIPFMPVPGNLYKKYKAMHELGVSTVMQCWYFGNYPGLMNKAAGELSFAPFPDSEHDFLMMLAKTDWAGNEETVAAAWECFQESYSNFPVNLSFTWYGPVHHSVIWPLYLFPADKPISPSWKFTFPLESGDRIGECICYDHTLNEALQLLQQMNDKWQQGLQLLANVESKYQDNPARMLDIYLAKALGIQIKSANNVYKFYSYREQLPFINQAEQLELLNQMKTIVTEEIASCKELKELCALDSRLGFHSEAEGYKYDPPQLDKRISQLEQLLADEFPRLTTQIKAEEDIFPCYSGKTPVGKSYQCSDNIASANSEEIPDSGCSWKASINETSIQLKIEGPINSEATVIVEPCRLWPAQYFTVHTDGTLLHRNFKTKMDRTWQADINNNGATFTIPRHLFDGYYQPGRFMRINVNVDDHAWVKQNPLPSRLRLQDDNPADLGWLLFD